jgi:hypothetical protein
MGIDNPLLNKIQVAQKIRIRIKKQDSKENNY